MSRWTLILCSILALAGEALAGEAPPVHRSALVIGNDNYRNVASLANARSDAKAVAEFLRNVGFQVTSRFDLDQRAFKSAIREFKASLSGGDDVIFYYAGHGVELAGTNYLLPVDAQNSSTEDELRDDGIRLQRILDDLRDQKVRFSMVVIDACRENPLRQTDRAIAARGLAPTTPATGQMVMYSAGAGQRALDNLGDDDRDSHGLFTRVLLKEMAQPGVPADQIARRVRDEVARLARSVHHDQVPALYDQSLGVFFFREPQTGIVHQAGVVQTERSVADSSGVGARTPEAIEDEYWDAIKDSKDRTDFEEYRRRYPAGRYLALAERKIRLLSVSAKSPNGDKPTRVAANDGSNREVTPGRPADSVPGVTRLRFPVAHKHTTSWCYGYLTVDGEDVRYDVMQPQDDRAHSFVLKRSSVGARVWSVLGNAQPAIEIFGTGAPRVFYGLADETEVQTANGFRLSPPRSIPPDRLLAALRAGSAAIGASNAQVPPTPARAATSADVAGNSSVPPRPAADRAEKPTSTETSDALVKPLQVAPEPGHEDRFAGIKAAPVGQRHQLAGVTFIAPPGWRVESVNGAAKMAPPVSPQGVPCAAILFPPRPAQGDPVRQAEAIVNEIFASQQGPYVDTNGGDVKTSAYEGTAGQGWEYTELFGRLQRASETMVHVLLARTPGQVIPLVAATRDANCMGNEFTRDHDNWIRLFHSLQLPGYTEDSTWLRQHLVGTWGSTGSNVYNGVTYSADGHYGRVGAHATYTQPASRPNVVVQETTSWVGDGTYTVRGDRLSTAGTLGQNGYREETKLFSIVRFRDNSKPGGYQYRIRMLEWSGSERVWGASANGTYVYTATRDDSNK